MTDKSRVDLRGYRFGQLIVEDFVGWRDTPNGHRRSVWLCRCDCGVTKEIRGQNLGRGTASCGCAAKKKACLSGQEAVVNQLFSQYEHDSLRKGRYFGLDLDEFNSMVSSVCKYCGQLPEKKTIHRPRSKVVGYVNGVDRIDNRLGYISTNCVACCKACNYMKRGMSVSDFLTHVWQIARCNG